MVSLPDPVSRVRGAHGGFEQTSQRLQEVAGILDQIADFHHTVRQQEHRARATSRMRLLSLVNDRPKVVKPQPVQEEHDEMRAFSQHLQTRWDERHAQYLRVQETTRHRFEILLRQMDQLARTCQAQQRFTTHFPVGGGVRFSVDPDRSVGILSMPWQTLSVTLRDAHQPMAAPVQGKQHPLCGRIIALMGDYQDISLQTQTHDAIYDFQHLLPYELGSLYVGDVTSASPACWMTLRTPEQVGRLTSEQRPERLVLPPEQAEWQFLTRLVEQLSQYIPHHEG